jgi:biopolymer transport protein TolR
VLSIDKAGRIFLGAGNELALPEISKKLESVMATRPVEEQKLYIRGDTTISYGKIMEVIGEAHRAGIHQVGLISEPLDTK